MQNIKKILPGILVIFFCISTKITSQTPEFFHQANYNDLDFEYTTMIVPETENKNSKIFIVSRIPHNRLQFIREEDHFSAQYEQTVIVHDDNNEMVNEKSWIEELQTDTYSETTLHDLYHYTGIQFSLPPGKYETSIYVKDLETDKQVVRKNEIEIPDYSDDDIRITSILFLEKSAFNEDEIVENKPVVIDALDKKDKKYYAYFAIIPHSADEKFNVEAELKSFRKRDKVSVKLGMLNQISDSERIPVIYEINAQDFPAGSYKLEITVKSDKKKREITKNFTLSWTDVPTSETDLDVALAQMKYAFQEVMEADLKDLSYEDKLKLFQFTWDRRDPSPGTDFNEIKSEYFRRVKYANKNFSVFRDGWKTDRGMIYILFGPPNEIVRYDYHSATNPIQYWSYYSYNITFEFYDRDGFGDFLLTTPFDYNLPNRPIK